MTNVQSTNHGQTAGEASRAQAPTGTIRPTGPAVLTDVPSTDPLVRIALVGLFIIFVGFTLSMAHAIIVPVVAALVLGSMLGPLVDRGDRLGLPAPVGAGIVLLAFAVIVYGLFIALSGPVSNWMGRVGEVGPLLHERLRFMDRPLAAMKTLMDALQGPETGITVGVKPDLVQNVLLYVTPALTEVLIFLGTLYFFLADRRRLKQKLVSNLAEREIRLRVLHVFTEIEAALRRYMTLVTLINIGLGVATTLAMFAIGLPSPILWGVLACTLNFVPYLGAAINAVILLIVGLFTFPTIGEGILPPLAFLTIATIEGQFITPSLMSQQLTTRPFFVFLALAFWTWLWGPIGAFLAVPLMIVALVVHDQLADRDDGPHLP